MLGRHKKKKKNKLGEKKAQRYLDKYGDYEAYNSFGGRTVEEGVERMEEFYQQHPEAPV